MDKQTAWRKWKKLAEITVKRGAGIHEAATAAKLADVLAKKYGFVVGEPEPRPQETNQGWREDFDVRFRRAEHRAAMRWAWEYRTCGKARCRCMRGGAPHGPYKYGKERTGKTVRSIYLGL